MINKDIEYKPKTIEREYIITISTDTDKAFVVTELYIFNGIKWNMSIADDHPYWPIITKESEKYWFLN